MASKNTSTTHVNKIIFQKRPEIESTVRYEGISSFYADLVFGPKAQANYLSTAAQNAIAQAASHGQPISRETADEVAAGMQAWALDLGATHYTHWFQPLRGTTAEKHDSFRANRC